MAPVYLGSSPYSKYEVVASPSGVTVPAKLAVESPRTRGGESSTAGEPVAGTVGVVVLTVGGAGAATVTVSDA